MCAPSQGAMLPYGLKIPSPYFPFGPAGGLTQAHLSALDFQRSQLNDYNVRVQFGLRNYQNSIGLSPFHAYITDPYTQAYFYKHDPRARFVQEEPKPSHSYIGLIGMAILNAKEKKLVLSDIYQWILDNYPYFRTRGPGWRNSIRHNLSLNDCFIKAGRSANGKGHYWAVHPANIEDFERGDFRRRRAQRKVRRHMGLSVPDDDDSPTPSPTQPWPHHDINPDTERGHLDAIGPPGENPLRAIPTGSEADHLVLSHPAPIYGPVHVQPRKPSKKRLFDMASLLAPDDDDEDMKTEPPTQHDRTHDQEIAGVSFHPISDNLKPSSIKTERKSSSDNTTDSIGSNSTQELIIDINSSSSGSGKEVSYDSDYDTENNNVEIQVTSGENSPAQGMTEVCDMDPKYSVNGEYLTRNGNHAYDNSKIKTEIQDQNRSLSHSYPYQQISSKDSKAENALDLSSTTSSGNENKSGVPSHLDECNANFIVKQEEDDKSGRQLNHMGMNGDAVAKKDVVYDGYNVNGEPQSSYNDSVSAKNSYSPCNQDRPSEHGTLFPRVINNRCDHSSDSMPHNIVNNGSELPKMGNTENVHNFHSDLLRQQNQRSSESKFGVIENGHRGPDSGNLNTDMRGAPLENSIALSEAMRISVNNSLRWSDISKNTSRDRMSAFSTLGIRNQGMYSPFQMRSISLGTQRLLPTSTPLRGTGIPPPLINVSSCHSAPLSMLSGIDVCANNGGSSSTSSNSSTGSTRSNSRD